MMRMNKIFRMVTAVCLCVVLLFGSVQYVSFASESSFTDAERAEIQALRDKQAELDKKIEAAEAEIDALSKDIENEQAYAEQLTEQLDNLSDQIDVLNDSISLYEKEISRLSDKIAENVLVLDEIESEMYAFRKQALDLQQQSEDTYDLLLERLRYMYMTGETTELEALLDSDSLYSFLIRLELINTIADHDDKLIDTLHDSIQGAADAEDSFRLKAVEQQDVIVALENDSAAVKEQQDEVVAAREKLEDTQSQQQSLYREAMANIDKLNEDVAGYDELVEMYHEEREQFDRDIDRMIAEFSANHTPPAPEEDEDEDRPSYSSTYIHPLSQYSDAYISSYYGGRSDPATGIWKYHYALDICCWSGTSNKNVVAAADGTVVTATWHSSYGYYVLIAHDTGVYTLMAHNNQLLVSAGERVYQGQVVAKAGATGYVTGAHVHFEVRVNGEKVNPLNYVSIG